MKKTTIVGCFHCLKTHAVGDRVKPDVYSGGEWITECPFCGRSQFVSTRQLMKIKRDLTS